MKQWHQALPDQPPQAVSRQSETESPAKPECGASHTLCGVAEQQRCVGDFNGARDLVMTYGTKVDQTVHAQILERMRVLNMPKVVGFITPVLVQTNGTVELKQADDFLAQQLELHQSYART